MEKLNIQYQDAKRKRDVEKQYELATAMASNRSKAGDLTQAEFYHDTALRHVKELLRDRPDEIEFIRRRIIHLYELAKVIIENRPDDKQALKYLQEARELGKKHDLDEDLQDILIVMFAYFHQRGDIDSCTTLNKESEVILEKISKKSRSSLKKDEIILRKGNMYLNYGIIYFQKKDLTTAEEYFQTALQMHENIESHYEMAVDLSFVANVHLEQGLYDEAHTELEKVRRSFERQECWSDLIKIMGDIADLHRRWANDVEEGGWKYLEKAGRYLGDQLKLIQKHCPKNKAALELNDQARKQQQSTEVEFQRVTTKINLMKKESDNAKKIPFIKEIVEITSHSVLKNETMKHSIVANFLNSLEGREKVILAANLYQFLVEQYCKGDLSWEEDLIGNLEQIVKDSQVIDDASLQRAVRANLTKFKDAKDKKLIVSVNNDDPIELDNSQEIEIIQDVSEQRLITLKGDVATFQSKIMDLLNKITPTSLNPDISESITRKYGEILSELEDLKPSKKQKM